MDSRLIPINAFIALASPRATSWPSTLHDIGFELEGLEIPANAAGDRVVIDCVAFNPTTNQFMSAESKSGSNIEADQARRYRDVDPRDLVRLIGVTIESAGDLTIETVYVCLEDSVDRVRLGLTEAGCEYPILAVGRTAVAMNGHDFAREALAAAFALPVPVTGPPPAIVKVDDQSPEEEYDRIVAAALIAEVSQGTEIVSCPELAARAVPHLSIFGQGHRNRLIRAVTQAARRISDADPGSFEFRGTTQERDHGIVKILDNPELADPRGRTQRYQALKGRLGGVVPSEPGPEQGSLFDDIDLAAELEKADTGEPDDDQVEEER